MFTIPRPSTHPFSFNLEKFVRFLLRKNVYINLRRHGWSQRLEIIIYLICPFFVIPIFFRHVGLSFVCHFLSFSCHFLSFVCHLFVLFPKTVSFFDDFVGGRSQNIKTLEFLSFFCHLFVICLSFFQKPYHFLMILLEEGRKTLKLSSFCHFFVIFLSFVCPFSQNRIIF